MFCDWHSEKLVALNLHSGIVMSSLGPYQLLALKKIREKP